LRLRKKIQAGPDLGWRARYGAEGTEEVIGPDAAQGSSAINVFQGGDTAGA
jgi:hypothetical protein